MTNSHPQGMIQSFVQLTFEAPHVMIQSFIQLTPELLLNVSMIPVQYPKGVYSVMIWYSWIHEQKWGWS